MFQLRFLSVLAMCALICSPVPAVERPAAVQAYLNAHCMDCHSESSAEAGLNLDALSAELSHSNYDRWVRILDRVQAGEMPPADYERPDAADQRAFLSTTSDWLIKYEEKEDAENGRVRGRRLTNLQLERSLHDLLGIDIPLATLMPDDRRTNGYTTVASGQSISHFQLQTHLTVVDAALDEAFRRAFGKPDEWSRTFSPRQIARRNPRRRCREPEMLNGAAVVWSGRTTFYGRLPVTAAREPGWYQIQLRTSALNVPDQHGVWATVRKGMCVSSAPMLGWAGAFEATEEPREMTFRAWLDRGEMFEVRPGDLTQKQASFAGGQIGAGEGEPQNVPGIAHHSLTLSRIHLGGTNEEIRDTLIGDLDWELSRGDDKAPVVMSERRPKDASELLSRFAAKAFRRPVSRDDMQPYVNRVHEDLKAGVPFLQALRGGYRAVLCSPRFLYFEEHPGRLDAYSLATRLSYLLWNSMPDERLLSAAEDNSLLDGRVLRQQTERMLKHDRGRNFVKDFAHQWLDLSEIDFTEPDRKLYRGFDVIVQQSMVEETNAFLQEMLDRDLSVGNLIDSEFTYLNNRLARHYGISDVSGDSIQKVSLDRDDHRGGVLTHGSVLKVTANGSSTSPVLRGVWVAERLLGQEIPPPPDGVPAIEPDIRGASSIREMLEKHKADVGCASCHVKIDPPGFALENFDPAGQWRDRYLSVSRGRKRGDGPVIDAGYETSDGRSFSGLREFQRLMLSDRQALAHNVVSQLLTYGTGAEVRFADRREVQRLVTEAKAGDYGFRSLLHAAIGSEIFQSK